jgi:hypothetical protein
MCDNWVREANINGSPGNKEAWEYMEKVVRVLGPDGMSSDKSEVNIQKGLLGKVFTVHRMEWRQDFKSIMDIIDNQAKIAGNKV